MRRLNDYHLSRSSPAELIETLREIRNSCRDFMTRHSAEISRDEQRRWWDGLDPQRNYVRLFKYEGTFVGYGLINHDEQGRIWLSGGLLPAYRGKGFGYELFGSLITPGRVAWLEVLATNKPAIRTYRRLGFREEDRYRAGPEVIVMRRPDYPWVPLFKVRMAPSALSEVAKVLASGYLGQGPTVTRFEAKLREVLRADRDVLTVNSCTSALDLALHLIGVGPGDRVITTPMTCTATNSPIVTRGAIPVWADVDRTTGLINPESVSALFDDSIKAVIAVDWGGRPCNYDALRKVAPGCPIIEDAAHGPLITYNADPIARAGGDYITFSFQAIKALTTGDGGALIVPKHQVERARLLRWYGLDRTSGESFRCKQNIQEVGYKYHMNDVAAAIGLANLELLEDTTRKHKVNATYYAYGLRNLKGVELPPQDPDCTWWLYSLLVDDRDGFIDFMASAGIACSPVHARNDHHAAFRSEKALIEWPRAGLDYFAAHEVAIPVGWWVTDDDREYVMQKVREWSTR